MATLYKETNLLHSDEALTDVYGREIKRSFSLPKYESFDHGDRDADAEIMQESLTVNKPTEIFEDEESREALENVIDGILTQNGCGNDATLDIVHHTDGSETWNLKAYADTLTSSSDGTEDDRPAMVISVDVDNGGIITHIEGQDGISAVINSRIDSQSFLDFVRSQVSEYMELVGHIESEVQGDAVDLGVGVTALTTNLRETSQNIARAIDSSVQSVCADYIIDLTRVYSSSLSETSLVSYTGNYADKDRMPHKLTVDVVPYNNALAMVITSDGTAVKTAEDIKDASAFVDWVRDSASYRMNEGRKLVLRSVR